MNEVIGIQAARAILRDTPNQGRCLYVQQGRRDARVSELIALAHEGNVRFQTVESGWFKRRADGFNHQGVLLECHIRSLASDKDLQARWDTFGDKPLILVLDGIMDPRNLGACLRSANAAGVDAVILPKRNSAPLSMAALRTAQGGAEDLFIVEVTNLARCMRWLKERNVWIVGAAGESDAIWTDVAADAGLVWVLGSEDKGLRRLTRSLCDQLVAIPMLGRVESLNVAVATGILLFESVRQRRG